MKVINSCMLFIDARTCETMWNYFHIFITMWSFSYNASSISNLPTFSLFCDIHSSNNSPKSSRKCHKLWTNRTRCWHIPSKYQFYPVFLYIIFHFWFLCVYITRYSHFFIQLQFRKCHNSTPLPLNKINYE